MGKEVEGTEKEQWTGKGEEEKKIEEEEEEEKREVETERTSLACLKSMEVGKKFPPPGPGRERRQLAVFQQLNRPAEVQVSCPANSGGGREVALQYARICNT